jgi:hypothetical protein
MSRSLNEITSHIRAACANPSVKATLIQTEDLIALCDAVDMPLGGTAAARPASAFVLNCLQPKPDWKEQPFEYYAAHFLVGAGLIGGDLEANIRGLTDALRKQYDVGVKHGASAEHAPA